MDETNGRSARVSKHTRPLSCELSNQSSLLETAHAVLNIHGVYWFLVVNYFNPMALLVMSMSTLTSLLITLCVALISHVFYAYRVYIVSNGNRWIAAAIVVLALGRASHLFTLYVEIAIKSRVFTEVEHNLKWAKATLAFSFATDFLIATSLTYYLHRQRSGRTRTDTLLTKLMILAVNNGFLTSAVDLLVLVFIIVAPKTLIFLAIFVIEGNLYTNSLLATLNARHLFRQQISRGVTYTGSSTMAGSAQRGRRGGSEMVFATRTGYGEQSTIIPMDIPSSDDKSVNGRESEEVELESADAKSRDFDVERS